jgi:hypothetical protein
MKDFQDRLDKLPQPPTSDSVERIGKEMELQLGIYDILIKYREAQQSKFTLFVAAGATVAGALLGVLGNWLGAWLRMRAGKSSRKTGQG